MVTDYQKKKLQKNAIHKSKTNNIENLILLLEKRI